MTSTRSWIAAALTAASLSFGWASLGLAQEKPKDEGLEKLLEKLEAKDKPVTDAPKDRAPEKPKETAPDKPKETAPDKPKSPGADKSPAPGQVAPKDQDIDKLLEGLGQTKDIPSPDDKKPGGGPGPDDPKAPKPDQPKPDELKGGEKDLDKELEKLTGKIAKPKNKPRDRQGEEEGPLGDVIKQMRDVEERLGKPDTGEETRKKQTEIVKNLDNLLEQLKNAPSQSQGMKMIREGKKPGQQPGQPQGNQPGAQAQGAQPTRPNDPKMPPIPLELTKKLWGLLPAQFREEMGNVMNEHPLPTKADLIRLYYLSLGNKNSNGGE